MLAVFAFQYAIAEDQTELRLSNCKDNIVAYITVSSSVSSGGAALYYPETTMQMYAGCQIETIKIGTISSSSDGGLRIFITSDLNGTPEYEQTCTASKSGWNTIELDSAYTISGEALYIGYEITGFRFLSVCEVLIPGEEWTRTTTGGWKKYDGEYSSAIEAIVTGDNLPKNNIYLNDVTLPGYVTTNSPVECSGTFYNIGASPVESLTITYMIDSVAAYSETVSVDSTGYRAAGSFTASGFSLGEEGSSDVYIDITEVNNAADANPADNTSRTKSILCRDSFTQRKILLEVFSTELCVNCAAAHEVIEEVYDGYSDIIQVGHHAGYYTDDYTIDASSEYEWFYGTMVYAPAVMLDRTLFDNIADDYSYDGTPVTAPSEERLNDLYGEASAVPAFVTVNIDKNYDESTRHLSLTVSGEQLLPVDEYGDLRLNVFVLEDSIFTTGQSNTSGYFYHRYSIRECLTDVWGDSINVTDGYTATYETDIADTIDENQVYVVAFVANYDSADRTNCNVLNTDEVKIIADEETTGITSVNANKASDISISRDYIVTDGDCGSVSVYDTAGRCLINTSANGGKRISLSQLPGGTYIVRTGGENGKSIKIVR